jgi:hypothetical protein
MTTASSPARPQYHHMGEPISSPGVIDFFTERDRLLEEIDEFNRRHKITEEIRQAAVRCFQQQRWFACSGASSVSQISRLRERRKRAPR